MNAYEDNICYQTLTKDSGYAIGFGGKMYTLWVYSNKIEHDMRVLQLNYVKNLSKDRDLCTVNYPDAPVIVSLKGQEWKISRRVSTPTPKKVINEWKDLSIMPYGKYAGMQIGEIKEAGYWIYLANHTCPDDRYTNAEVDLPLLDFYEQKAAEYGGEKIMGYWIDKNSHRPWEENMRRISAAIAKKEPFDLFIEHRPDECACGCYWFSFPGLVYNTNYYGTNVYLKINGKNRRVKNKTIRIEDYSINEQNKTIIINKFTLL